MSFWVVGRVLGRFGGHPRLQRGRNQDHQSVDVGRIDPQPPGCAAVGGQLPGSGAPAENSDAEAGALGGVGEGLEWAARLGSVRHTFLKARSRRWRPDMGTKIMEWTSTARRTHDGPCKIELGAHGTGLHRCPREERATGARLDQADRWQSAQLAAQLFLQSRCYCFELGESSSEVLDDLAGDDVGGRQVVEVFERVVLQPGDVEVGLVARDDLVVRDGFQRSDGARSVAVYAATNSSRSARRSGFCFSVKCLLVRRS